MKGLTHFISGIAATTFIPEVVRRCAAARTMTDSAESSFLLALAGMYAIMPDTLDFKLGRFFEKADVEVFPDPANPDPQHMAELLGKAMDQAWTSGKEVRIQFHTLRYSADRWHQYEIKYDTTRNVVSIVMGEMVTTSQVPFPGTAPPNPVGSYELKHARLLPGSTRDTKVDIMSGPMYGFRRVKDYITVDFLPWHRTWSHSYTLGLALALPLWLLAALLGWRDPWLYPLVAFLGFATHITEDLTGHMGGSLIWPFIKTRTRGLKWFHAANPNANFVTDYIAFTIIIFNLDRFGQNLIPLSAPLYFLVFLAGPLVLYFLPQAFAKKPQSIMESLALESKLDAKTRSIRKGIEELESEADSVIS